MKKLLLSLLFVCLISSCSDNGTGPGNEFEQHTVGSFLITSQTTAEYEGVNNKQSGATLSDSVEVTSTNGYALTLVADPTNTANPNIFNISFTDSSLTNADSVNIFETEFVFPESNLVDDPVLYKTGGGNGINPNRFYAQADVVYFCNPEKLDDDSIISVRIYSKADELYRVYSISVLGFLDTLEEIIPCS